MNYALPWWLSGKESACWAGDAGSIPGWGRCPGGGHGNPIQYSCMENSKDRGGWQATIHGVAESRKPLGDLTTATINYSHNAVHYIPAAAAMSLQSCPTLCDPIDGSTPGSPVPGILQARTLEWVALRNFSETTLEHLCKLFCFVLFYSVRNL